MTTLEVANLDTRGMVGRINVKNQQTLLRPKSFSSGSYGFLEEEFWRFFSYTVLYKHMTPGVWPIWTPGAWLAGFKLGTTTHCYILNIWAVGLMASEKKTFLGFPYFKVYGS